MKKLIFLALGLSLILSACLPAFLQPQTNPTQQQPQVDLQATAGAMAGTLAAQTIAALPTSPTQTIAPSNTPVVATATISATTGPTENPILLTLTATLGTGTVTSGTAGLPSSTFTGTPPSATLNPATPTVTLHPRFYGTLPPDLPFGWITLVNKSKADTYISLQCRTSDGSVTVLEYPVQGTLQVRAPAGRYEYVAWVGGKQMLGTFRLDRKQSLRITLFKDNITVRGE